MRSRECSVASTKLSASGALSINNDNYGKETAWHFGRSPLSKRVRGQA